MEYQIIRSRRRTIAICISKDGAVLVRAPLRTAQSTIDRFVGEKQDWILEKSALMAANAAVREKFSITAGSFLRLLGNDYPVVLGENIDFTGNVFTITQEDSGETKPRIVDLYKTIAQRVIPERVAFFSKQTGLTPASVRIGSATTSWGSCTGKNGLHFSWKLIMAEQEVIDYVVVHELAHTMEHNHSARFWRLVEKILPDYQERRAKLKLLEKKLQGQDWS